MYCPNCGAKNNGRQNYCRFCGLSLRDVAKSLKSQLVFGEDSGLVKRLSSAKRAIDSALAVLAGVLIVSAVAYFFFGAGPGRDALKLGVVTFFLLEAILGAVGYYQRRERGKARAQNNERNTEELPEPKGATRLLEERPFEPLPSVVEAPTERLPVKNDPRRIG